MSQSGRLNRLQFYSCLSEMALDRCTVNSILRILAAKGLRLLLCAPMGHAAKRVSEATGIEARTIHRLLEIDPKAGGFRRGPGNPLDCDLLIIDETSMVPTDECHHMPLFWLLAPLISFPRLVPVRWLQTSSGPAQCR